MGFEIRVVEERQLNGFEAELADLWYRVSAAGGSVGFGTTVDRIEVERAAERVAGDVAAGRTPLLALRDDDGRLMGVVRLERGSDPVVAHRAMLKLLMIDPDVQGHGWGTRLVDGCVALARDLGIEQLYLSCRGRTGLEEYYTKLGWTEVGRYPGGVRVAPGDDRDEVWFFRPVDVTEM
jgi:GNAT superfamily N-acetyltransferase